MIVAALALLAVGGGDLVRRHVVRRRWVVYVVAAAVLVVLAAAVDAVAPAILALLLAAGWLLAVPSDGGARTGLWAAALLAAVCGVAVVLAPPRSPGIAIGVPLEVPLDVVLAALGAAVFLTESGNVLVRSALRREHAVSPEASGLKGGRLIGPLERLLVFALTLAGAYTLLAAVLAAKGIVRFPEISRDGETGERAEYFLIGSLVSWTAGLGAALLVWWGTTV